MLNDDEITQIIQAVFFVIVAISLCGVVLCMIRIAWLLLWGFVIMPCLFKLGERFPRLQPSFDFVIEMATGISLSD
jgi:putative exporter of polyketide antibiotics